MLLPVASGGRRWLEVGGPADVTIVDLNNARCQPVHSVASALVYNAAGPDVHTVIVGGQILLDAGRVTTVDESCAPGRVPGGCGPADGAGGNHTGEAREWLSCSRWQRLWSARSRW